MSVKYEGIIPRLLLHSRQVEKLMKKKIRREMENLSGCRR